MSEVRIRVRGILAGLVLGLGLCLFSPYNNAYLNNTTLGGGHFPMAPFFITAWLLVLVALTAKLTRRGPLFNGMELLVIWLMMVLGTAIGWTGLVETFFVNITAPLYFAKDAYKWTQELVPFLPQAWYPHDPQAVELLFNGMEGGRELGWTQVLAAIPWGVWLPPLLVWGGFILLCYGIMLCLVNLFGRQWVVNERVNFPLLQVPQTLAESLDEHTLWGVLRNKYLLTGLFMAAALQTVNGLNFHYPAVPQIPTHILAGTYFPKFGIFSGFYHLQIYIVPAFIGFAFLATRQISFSFWVFHLGGLLLFGLLAVFGMQYPEAAMGVTFGPLLARPEEAQGIGAYLVFALFLLYLARFHLMDTLRAAMGRPLPRRPGDERGHTEWLPAPWSLWGALLGFLLLVWWCLWFGLPLAAAVLVPVLFFMVLLVISRLVCQGGLPYFTMTAAPMDGLVGFLGSRFMTQTGLLAAAVMQKVLFLDVRESVMPSLFHGAKLSERARNQRLMLVGIALILVAAVAVSFVTMLALGHKFGLREMKMEWATQSTLAVYESAQKLMDAPTGPNAWIYTFAGAGAVVMLVLVFCYYRFSWWPLHPLGYLAAYGFGMRILWFSFLVGWACNHLSLHYGGTALYRRMRLLFIGLIMGDFLIGGVWAVVGLVSGTSFRVFPI